MDDTNLANLEAEEPALDRMNSSLASIRFQYFSPPLHSTKLRACKSFRGNYYKVDRAVAYHNCNTSTKLNCWAAWCGMDDRLCKSKDIHVFLDAFFNLYEML